MENKTLIIMALAIFAAIVCIPLWLKTSKPLYKYFRSKNTVSGRDIINKSSLSIDLQKRTDAILYMLLYYAATLVIALLAAVFLAHFLGIVDINQK